MGIVQPVFRGCYGVFRVCRVFLVSDTAHVGLRSVSPCPWADAEVVPSSPPRDSAYSCHGGTSIWVGR